MLLAGLPGEATFNRRLRGIHLSDSIQGPLAVQWMQSTLARAMPPGKDQILVLQQMAIVTAELRLMRRLKAGWSKFAPPCVRFAHPLNGCVREAACGS